MNNINKGKSPFYPGQPVPNEFFTGRIEEINRISRAIYQVELGKPQAVFLTGEYGIGKSSLASFMQYIAEKKNHILGIHILLGSANTIEDVAAKTVESVLKAQVYEQTVSEKIRHWLSKYIGDQQLFGFNINLDALRVDSPNISRGYLPFLGDLLNRIKDSGIKGVMLIFDEINGIANNEKFAHFIKTLIDENALNKKPIPLLLMLCGIDERRKQMIEHHQPIERIFDIVEISSMNKEDTIEFFNKAFGNVNTKVTDQAMSTLCHYSAGYPKIMHIIGDAVFWIDQDNIIDESDAMRGTIIAAEEVGKKFVDQQVYRALRSRDYHSILNKLAKSDMDLSFQKKIIEKELSVPEKQKFNNFLQRMKKLNVLRSGDEKGEYIFNSRLVRLYILLNSLDKEIS